MFCNNKKSWFCSLETSFQLSAVISDVAGKDVTLTAVQPVVVPLYSRAPNADTRCVCRLQRRQYLLWWSWGRKDWCVPLGSLGCRLTFIPTYLTSEACTCQICKQYETWHLHRILISCKLKILILPPDAADRKILELMAHPWNSTNALLPMVMITC